MGDRNTSLLRLEQVDLKSGLDSNYLLQNISFDVLSKTKVAVVGASGAGKTSLLRLLNRLVSPSQGNLYLANQPIEQLTSVQLRRRLVLVPQEPKLLRMEVRVALSYALELQQLPQSEINHRIDTWTNLLRIPQQWFNKTELQLSMGQRQLVATARALIMQPQILLLDEPTSALDIGTATHLLSVLTKLNQSSDLTIIMVNHQLQLIQDFCDRILYLAEGKLAADLPASQHNWQEIEQKMMRLKTAQSEEWDDS